MMSARFILFSALVTASTTEASAWRVESETALLLNYFQGTELGN